MDYVQALTRTSPGASVPRDGYVRSTRSRYIRQDALYAVLVSLFLALMTFASSSHAVGNVGTTFPADASWNDGAGHTAATCAAVCTIVFSLHAPLPAYTCTLCNTSTGSCRYDNVTPANCASAGGNYATVFANYTCPTGYTLTGTTCNLNTSGTCPANSTRSGANCTCNSGYSVSPTTPGTCQSDNNNCPSLSGQKGSAECVGSASACTGSGTLAAASASMCINPGGGGTGCRVTITDAVGNSTGQSITFNYTAVSCSGTLTNAGAPTCPPGSQSGTVNGQTVCVPSPTQTSTSGSTTTTPATPTTNPAAPVGSTTATTTTDTSTTCVGTACTTTTTNTTQFKDSTGANVGTPQVTTSTVNKPAGQKTEMDDFCSSHPNSIVCLQSTFGGACGSWNCSGDAAQCAAAKAINDVKCALTDTTSASTLGNQAAAGTDPLASTFPNPAAPTVTALGSSLDQSSWLSSSCPADVTVTLPMSLGAVTIPFSSLCSVLTSLGYAMVAIALIIAARTIGVW